MACDNPNHQDESWVESDLKGVYLGRVCDQCRREVLRKFRPEVLSDEQCEAAGYPVPTASYSDVVEEPVEAEP
jgi:hypothetical protein